MYPALSTLNNKELFSILKAVISSEQRNDIKIDVAYTSGLSLKATYYPELVGNYYKDLMATSAEVLAQEAREQAKNIYDQYYFLFDEYQQFTTNSGNLD
jgi:hypothetical protein